MPAGEESERAAERFYSDALGLRPVVAPTGLADRGGSWFEGPCVRVHLTVEEPFNPDSGTRQTALVVDDIDAMRERIVDTGGEVTNFGAAAGPPRAYCEDPFGNRIELVESSEPTLDMFRVMVDDSIYPVSLIDHDGVIRWVGASVERFFGYRPEDLIDKRFDHIVAPGSVAAAYEAFSQIQDAFEPTPWGGVGTRVSLLHADGHEVSCELAALTTQRTGLPWYVVLVRQAGYERALDQAVEAMAGGAPLGEVLALVVSAVEHMVPETGVAVCDRWTGDHFAVTAGSATSLLAAQPASPWSRALATGDDIFVEERSRLPGPLAALAKAEGYEACWVRPVALADEEQPGAAIILWRRMAGAPTRFTWNTLLKAGQLLRLVLQWDRSHRSLEFAATHDALTGLANRQSFQDRLVTVAKSRSGRAAVLYIDLDRFKPVNDQLGHQMGDRALAVVAERLVAALRPGDLVARMGGDEFAVLCERMDEADVAPVADRLLEVIREPITTLTGQEFSLDASVGVTEVHGGEMVDTILARADEAMRAAKRAGRGRWTRAHGLIPGPQ
jgi:diguanylate cyclase (GGDEF)-like protein/PAS domain S-box-containing protein